MSSWIEPTVLAASVTALALVLRELIGRVYMNRQGQRDMTYQQAELTLSQVKLLWEENARLKADAAQLQKLNRELRDRLDTLAARCRELEQHVAALSRRLDR